MNLLEAQKKEKELKAHSKVFGQIMRELDEKHHLRISYLKAVEALTQLGPLGQDVLDLLRTKPIPPDLLGEIAYVRAHWQEVCLEEMRATALVEEIKRAPYLKEY